jgi:hypothetical protein
VGAFFESAEQQLCPFLVWSYGKIEIQFQHMIDDPIFGAEEKRRQLLDKLNAINAIAISPDSLTKRPSIPLAVLDQAGLDLFISTMDWFVMELKG